MVRLHFTFKRGRGRGIAVESEVGLLDCFYFYRLTRIDGRDVDLRAYACAWFMVTAMVMAVAPKTRKIGRAHV